MLSLKDFKKFEVKSNSFFGGSNDGKTQHSSYDEDYINGDIMYGAEDNEVFVLGCRCDDGMTFSVDCC